MVKGKVIQFRRGRKTYKPRHFLLEIPGCDNKEKAEKFKGKPVEWKSPGKEAKIIKGKIVNKIIIIILYINNNGNNVKKR